MDKKKTASTIKSSIPSLYNLLSQCGVGLFFAVSALCGLWYPSISLSLYSIFLLFCMVLIGSGKLPPWISVTLSLCSSLLVFGFTFGNDSIHFQRFFTLPAWIFVAVFLLFVWPRVAGFRAAFEELTTSFGGKQKLAVLILFILLLTQLLYVGTQILGQISHTYVSRHLSIRDRYSQKRFGVGEAGWFFRVGQFVEAQIKRDPAVVLALPRQGDPWIKSSNPAYMNYFISPAQTVSLPIEFDSVPTDATHILITRGETDTGNFGWPKQRIPRERIKRLVRFDPFTGVSTDLTGRDYLPSDFSGVYGLIELQ